MKCQKVNSLSQIHQGTSKIVLMFTYIRYKVGYDVGEVNLVTAICIALPSSQDLYYGNHNNTDEADSKDQAHRIREN